MIRYETLLLARTEITNEEFSLIEKTFETVVNNAGGKISAVDRWGKYRLSYAIKKQEYGIYYLIRFDVPADKVSQVTKEIREFFRIKCSEFVLRNVIVRLEDDAPTTYKRPEPVDSPYATNGGVDSFIKENKLDSFSGRRGAAHDSDDMGMDSEALS